MRAASARALCARVRGALAGLLLRTECIHADQARTTSGGAQHSTHTCVCCRSVFTRADVTQRPLPVALAPALLLIISPDPVGSPDRATFEDAGLTECTDKTLEGMEVVSTYIDRLMMLTLAAGAGAGGS